jgi:hypothetical protein
MSRIVRDAIASHTVDLNRIAGHEPERRATNAKMVARRSKRAAPVAQQPVLPPQVQMGEQTVNAVVPVQAQRNKKLFAAIIFV